MDEKQGDAVEHPPHYTSHPSGVECITIVKHLDYCTGNVFKYLWRAGLKDPATELEDLLKARTYLDYRIDLVRERMNERSGDA